MQLILFVVFMLSSISLYGNPTKAAPAIERLFLTKQEMESHPDCIIRSLAEFEERHPSHLLFLRNFPVGKEINYSTKRLCQKESSYIFTSELTVDQDGIITIDNTKAAFIYIPSKNFLLGERFSCQFTSKDEKFKEILSFIPNPLISKNDSKTVSIEAELKTLIPACFYSLKFDGFEENEKLTLISTSGNEKIENSFKLKKGLEISYSPDVEGEKGGIGHVSFKRKSGEIIQIDLPWGNQLIEGMKTHTER